MPGGRHHVTARALPDFQVPVANNTLYFDRSAKQQPGAQVHQEEEERDAGAEGRDDKDRAEEHESELLDRTAHRSGLLVRSMRQMEGVVLGVTVVEAEVAVGVATGIEARISRTMRSGSTSRSEAWLLTIRRWARIATASDFTSSGMT